MDGFSRMVCGHNNLQPMLVELNSHEYRNALKLDYFKSKNSYCFYIQTLLLILCKFKSVKIPLSFGVGVTMGFYPMRLGEISFVR